MVFYDRDRQILHGHHNKPLYVTDVHGVKLSRELIDSGYLMKIIPLSMLEAMGTPQDRIR